jgi:hypothetical protein
MAEENTYPAVRFMQRSGHMIAAILGLLVLAGGVWLTAEGHGWGWTAGGVIIGAVVYGFVILLRELVQIIADTLLPQ